MLIDLLTRYGRALAEARWIYAAALSAVLLLCWRAGRLPAGRARSHVQLAMLAAVAVAGSLWAWSLCWASDDAYISYRYADNLARGHGLVFNVGERVEGYTNFLWTVIVAGFIRMGADPGHAGILLSLASFVGMLVLLERLARRLGPREPSLPVGLGPLLAAASYTVASFATSGLETVFAATLTVLALERAEARRPFAAGLAGVLATMAHPDHALFYAALGAAMLLDRARRRELIAYAIPLVAVFLPYFLWRWSYYGDPMPNTFYAKSADQTYFTQGGVYLLVSFVATGLWAALPLAAIGATHIRRTVTGRFCLIGVPVYLVYVAKIGGDFMFARLFTPVLALAFLLADLGLRACLSRGRVALGASLACLAALAALPARVIRPGEIYRHIADERTFVPVVRFATMQVDAKGYHVGHGLYRELTSRGLQPKVGIWSIGMASYYARLPVFDLRGLTSRNVAHMRIRHRGRPGHEKSATPGHLLEARVDMAEMPVFPPPYDGLSRLSVGGTELFLTHYRPELVNALPPSSGLADFGRHIDTTLPGLGREGPVRLACDLWQMKEYYFSFNPDPTRRAAVIQAATQMAPDLAPVAPLLLEPRPLAALGLTRVRSVGFEPGEPAWTAQGEAARWPVAVEGLEQSRPFGQTGRFVNSFTDALGDGATGALTSPPFVIEGDVLTLRVGGGADIAREGVDLIVGGAPVRSAAGCDSEWLGDRVWDVRPWRGQRAQIVVRDHNTGGWGHVLVDDISEWRAPR